MVACNSKSKSDQTKTEEKAVLTKCTDVTAETVHITETYTSEIEPFKENDITPAASGLHIDRILVDVGDRVAAGQARKDHAAPAGIAAQHSRGRIQAHEARI